MRKCEAPGHERVTHKSGRTNCQTCRRLRYRATAASDPEFYKKKYQREKVRVGFVEKQAKRARRFKYGIDEIPEGSVCGICRERPATDVDHDHRTGAIRGFLCRRCNVWLGVAENEEFLYRAYTYLSDSRGVQIGHSIVRKRGQEQRGEATV